MNKDKNSDGMDELREAAKEAAKWYKENPPGRLRFTMLMAEDEGQHMADIVSLSQENAPTNSAKMKKYVSDLDDCLARFIKTFGD